MKFGQNQTVSEKAAFAERRPHATYERRKLEIFLACLTAGFGD